jgi:hypothetical protein
MRSETSIERTPAMNKPSTSIKKPCNKTPQKLTYRQKYEEVDKGEMDPELYYLVYFNLGLALTHTRKYGDVRHI